MPELPKKKVGIVACSGEDLPEGTVTRLAALKVLEELRPDDTVTICLPLFLAGGEGDRAFARFYPTIAVDGCELRCAARGTEKYSGRPAAGVVVTELCKDEEIGRPQGYRRLDENGVRAVERTASRVAVLVDDLLGKRWSRREGRLIEDTLVQDTSLRVLGSTEKRAPEAASCSCGSGIPVQEVLIDGKPVTLVALPLIFEQMQGAGKAPGAGLADELLDTVRVYNDIPDESREAYATVLIDEYAVYCRRQKERR